MTEPTSPTPAVTSRPSASVVAEAPPFFRTLSSGALLGVTALLLLFLFGLGYLLMSTLRKPVSAQADTRPIQPPQESQILAQLSALEAQAKALQQRQKLQDSQLPPVLRPADGAPPGFAVQPPPVQVLGPSLQPWGDPEPDLGDSGGGRSGPRPSASAPSPLTRARSAPLVPQGFRPSAETSDSPSGLPANRDPRAMPPGYPDPATLADSLLTRITPVAGQPQVPGAAVSAAGAGDTTVQRQEFLRTAAGQSAPLYTQVLHPLPTPYTLLQGTVLPAVLESALNSDLPGQTSALLRRNVYDSATGQHLLLPKGARLLGNYDSRIVFGERRILVAWERLLLPSGDSVDLHGMPGVDGLRAAGLSDRVNNHLVQLFGNALLLSALSAGAQLSQPQQSTANTLPSASQIAAAAVGQELSQVGTALINRQLNVKPTLTIAPGYLFNVELTADLAFAAPPTPALRPGR